jgi:23S rRNA pseudouridine1911/1915/1917 synthase
LTPHVVTPEQNGIALDRLLRELLPGKSWNDARKLVTSGKVTVDGRRVLEPSLRLKSGTQIELRMSAPRPKAESALAGSAIVHVDSQLVVVRKPAGISTVPYDENETGTLDELVRGLLEQRGRKEPPLGIVHRLDKDTSGLLVFARTLTAKRALKQAFRFHTVRRRYLAIAHGAPPARSFKTRLIQDRGDGRRGSTSNPELGREAITHVKVVERLQGATLIECQLETGRTHQIRIHLSEAGYPVVGDKVYTKGYEGALLSAPRLMLHAFELGFEHPASGQAMLFEEPLPEDMERVLEFLRQNPAKLAPPRRER